MSPHFYTMFNAGKSFDVAYPRRTAEVAAKDTSLDKQASTYLIPPIIPFPPQPGLFKNTDRSQEKKPRKQKTALRIHRAEAATANGLETLGMYAGGIAAAAGAGVPAETVSWLGAGYLASRVVFNAVYVFLQDDKRLAPLRSVAWNVSVGFIAALWVKAGNRAAARFIL